MQFCHFPSPLFVVPPQPHTQSFGKVSAPAHKRGAACLGHGSARHAEDKSTSSRYSSKFFQGAARGTQGLRRLLGAALVFGCIGLVGGGGLAFDVSLLPCRSYVCCGRSGPPGCARAEGCESRVVSRVQDPHWTCWLGCAFGSQFCPIVVTPPLAPRRAEVWSRRGGRNSAQVSSDMEGTGSSESGGEYGIEGGELGPGLGGVGGQVHVAHKLYSYQPKQRCLSPRI